MRKIAQNVRAKFIFATLSFIFIIIYVNLFPRIFGQENNIVAVIFTIMMSASMVRDLTAVPLKHLMIQAFTMVMMAVCACLVSNLDPWLALPVNFMMIFAILYAFTYEYADHLYFPYILSYLFLVFISPVGFSRLPVRMLAMAAGAVSVIGYQLVMGRKRVAVTARGILCSLIDFAQESISCRLEECDSMPDRNEVHRQVCGLSQTVHDRRKKLFQVSDAGFAMIDAGRGLEHVLLLLSENELWSEPEKQEELKAVRSVLNQYRAFLDGRKDGLPTEDDGMFERVGEIKDALLYVRDKLQEMTSPKRRTHICKTALSPKARLKAAIGVSPVRLTYALRTAILLSAFTLFVQTLALPHGKWLLFTLASLSLPYSDDVQPKMKKRVLATVIGGVSSATIYSLIPSAGGRTAAMMASGYLSFYFADYTGTFACSTVGALGGAVFMSSFSFADVGGMVLVRLCYIILGALIAYGANCLICPYSREKATVQLLKKYTETAELIKKLCRQGICDIQMYYDLVMNVHMQEEKLRRNAQISGWKEMDVLLERIRSQVRQEHRRYADRPALQTAE
ncbi:FUSC family protein [Lacrimispora sp. NSJ-141]|uniref:FUSC family protein n=1 Tax=Lientehia hominis TaxID=2897778 RepID=A0AAP2RLC2_9FIRM|nr:FUSC family protein [Lientehia hominis]MCD2493028.1 FUSC family protein [Lientehia hominis]